MRAPLPPATGVVRAWLLLGVAALAVATGVALLLAVSRAPQLGELVPSAAWFRTGLVLHVGLAVIVWFLCIGAAQWSALCETRRSAVDWLALGVSATGVAAMVSAPWLAPGEPVLSNYVPVLDSALFLAGLCCFGAGVVQTYLLALWRTLARAGRGASPASEDSLPALVAGIPLLMAIVSLAWAAASRPGALSAAVDFESLFWGAGHTLQFGYVCLLMLAWLALASAQGVAPARLLVRASFLLQVAPALAVPLLHAAWSSDAFALRNAFTALMTWGAWPGALLLGASLARGCARRPGADRGARSALYLSMLLFALGIALGAAIRDDSTVVPAHYHATVGAVTVALMALVLHRLSGAGWATNGARVLVVQTSMYAGGMTVLALSLAWAGWHGAARKTPIAIQALSDPGQVIAMACMAIGAIVAIAGAALFFFSVLRATLPGARRTLASIRDRRALTAWITAGLVALGGVCVSLLPGHAVGPRAQVQADSGDDPALRREFEEAVRLLRAGRHEQAAIALHGVLVRAPALPEAHANMGYALLGLGRNDEARDFFESASALRPAQANAYYGLAVALERLHDLPGAVGAMRTYLHLTHPSDPHLRKARAALWEWESELALLRTGQSLEAPGRP